MVDKLWLIPTFPLIGFLLLTVTEGRLTKLPVAIIGAGSVGQLEDNVGALDLVLEPDEIEKLDGLYRPRDVINDYVPDRVPRHLGGILNGG